MYRLLWSRSSSVDSALSSAGIFTPAAAPASSSPPRPFVAPAFSRPPRRRAPTPGRAAAASGQRVRRPAFPPLAPAQRLRLASWLLVSSQLSMVNPLMPKLWALQTSISPRVASECDVRLLECAVRLPDLRVACQVALEERRGVRGGALRRRI